MLQQTTLDLWPKEARQILKDKKVSVSQLKKMFTHICFPWDNVYNTERNYFSLRIQQRPLFIIKPENTDEIKSILNYIKLKNLTIRITVGRHSTQLCDSEVLVDMSLFTYKYIKDDHIIVGGGNTQGAVNDFLFHEGHSNCYSHFGHFHRNSKNSGNSRNSETNGETEALASGSASTVGVSGISTIGGIGTLKRTFGLTVDSIVRYVITIPPTENDEARTLEVSENQNFDLFWALKGGCGNNFGIISEIEYKIIEVNNVIQYSINWKNQNKEDIAHTIRKWRKNSIKLNNNFNESLEIFKVDGNCTLNINGFYVMNDNETYPQAKDDIIKTHKYLRGDTKINEKIKYGDLYRNLVKGRIYENYSIIQAIFMKTFSSKHIVQLIESTENIDISFELCGGRISEIPQESASFYPRKYNFFCDINTKWEHLNESQKRETNLNYILSSILRYNKAEPIAYVGFPITFTNIEYNNSLYYGLSYNRLKLIKKRYDPLNLLSNTGTI
jgi:hypothetical protein